MTLRLLWIDIIVGGIIYQGLKALIFGYDTVRWEINFQSGFWVTVTLLMVHWHVRRADQ